MRESLLRILALARKELLAVLKVRRSRMAVIIPPLVQTLIFGYAASYDLNHIPYAAFDQNRSSASRELLARLDGSGIFERVADLHSAAQLNTLIDERRAVFVLQIGSDFERKLLAGASASVQLIADGRNSNTGRTATGYVGNVIKAFNADWRLNHGGPGPGDGISVVSRVWYNPALETRWNMIPGMIGTLTLLQAMVLAAMSVAREREHGTFDQLLVTPFRPGEIMVGKALPAIFVGTVQASVILLAAQFWFRIPFSGSFLVLYGGLILFLLAAVGIGLALSSVAQTMQQALLFSFLLIMPFALLSGLTTPISNMPRILQSMTVVNPLRYAIDITQRVYLEGAGAGRLIHDFIPLAIIAAITLTAASWMFRNRME